MHEERRADRLDDQRRLGPADRRASKAMKTSQTTRNWRSQAVARLAADTSDRGAVADVVEIRGGVISECINDS
jgi:hypothetical protein